MDENSIPILRVSGGAADRGRQYGEQAADLIRLSVEAYRKILGHYTGQSWPQIRDQARSYADAVGSHAPHLLEEMRGIAQGAGLTFEDVLALNLRTELLNNAIRLRSAGECTAFILKPPANRPAHTLIGQNWDWKPGVADTLVLLVAEPDNAPNFVTLVEAGLLAKVGMNAAGIGLATNALISDHDSGARLTPYHVILRCILEAPSHAEAVRTLDRLPAASAANYLIADRQGAFENVEVLPAMAESETTSADRSAPSGEKPGGRLFRTRGRADRYVHTNHYLCGAPGFHDLGLELGPDSRIRLEQMLDHLDSDSAPLELEQIQAALADHFNHPYSICAHPDPKLPEPEQYASLASLIMDLETATMWLARGNPCRASYRRHDFAEFFGLSSPH